MFRRPFTAIGFSMLATMALAHGDVAPQPVNTDALPDVGEEWLAENPYRNVAPDVFVSALAIGDSAYNQNCARCHGLEVISGGLAPDLRFLEAEEYGDEWYVERFRDGYTQNGITKMPAFGELLGQKAAWAIRTYIETRPDDGALDPYVDRLKEIRDQLRDWSDAGENPADEIAALRAEMAEISGKIETGSGSPIAVSPASKAMIALDGSEGSLKRASEILKIGLSATN